MIVHPLMHWPGMEAVLILPPWLWENLFFNLMLSAFLQKNAVVFLGSCNLNYIFKWDWYQMGLILISDGCGSGKIINDAWMFGPVAITTSMFLTSETTWKARRSMNISLSIWELHTKIPSQLGRSDHFLHRLLAHTHPALFSSENLLLSWQQKQGCTHLPLGNIPLPLAVAVKRVKMSTWGRLCILLCLAPWGKLVLSHICTVPWWVK